MALRNKVSAKTADMTHQWLDMSRMLCRNKQCGDTLVCHCVVLYLLRKSCIVLSFLWFLPFTYHNRGAVELVVRYVFCVWIVESLTTMIGRGLDKLQSCNLWYSLHFKFIFLGEKRTNTDMRRKEILAPHWVRHRKVYVFTQLTTFFQDLAMTLGLCRVTPARQCSGWTKKNGSESVPDGTNCRAIKNKVMLNLCAMKL